MRIYALIYISSISLLAVVLAIHDKSAAKKNAWRVKERTLIAVSMLGGSAAMLITMLAVRYKTRYLKFMVGIPLIMLTGSDHCVRFQLKPDSQPLYGTPFVREGG